MQTTPLLMSLCLGFFALLIETANTTTDPALRMSFKDKIVALRESRRLNVKRKPRLVAMDGDDLLNDAIKIIGNSTHRYIRTDITYSLQYADKSQNVLMTSPEFYELMQRTVFTHSAVCFRQVTSRGRPMVVINPDCVYHNSETTFFNFVGIVMGLLFIFKVPLRVLLPRALFKVFMGEEVRLEDLEEMADPMHPRLQAILNRTDTETHVFSINHVDLMPEGGNTVVDEENCHYYVKLMIKHLTEGRYQKQITAMKSGFFQVIPRSLLEDFTAVQVKNMLYHPDPDRMPEELANQQMPVNARQDINDKKGRKGGDGKGDGKKEKKDKHGKNKEKEKEQVKDKQEKKKEEQKNKETDKPKDQPKKVSPAEKQPAQKRPASPPPQPQKQDPLQSARIKIS